MVFHQPFIFIKPKMSKEKTEKLKSSGNFTINLPEDFNFPGEAVGQRLLKEYGAMFIARSVHTPNKIVFKTEAEVSKFQSGVTKAKEKIGGFEVELQAAAMEKLKAAIREAEKNNLTITPRGADAAKRNYRETVELWASRINPGLEHWTKEGKLSASEAEKIRRLSPFEQVTEIFKLEEEGLFFSKDLSKTIIYSVAPPGTSQHLALLALDVREHADEKVRGILAKHGWFQTVISDLPHFTFLGVSEDELSGLGLKKIVDDEREFWIPNL